MGQRLNLTIRAKDKDVCNVYMHWSAYTSSTLSTMAEVVNQFKIDSINENSSVDEIVASIKKALPGSGLTFDELTKLGKLKDGTLTSIIDCFGIERTNDIYVLESRIKGVDFAKINFSFFEIETYGLSEAEVRVIKSIFNKCFPNRNDGLIAVTKEGMQETIDWEEGRATINLIEDDYELYFNVYERYDLNEVLKNPEEFDITKYKDDLYEKNYKGLPKRIKKVDCDFSEFDYMNVESLHELQKIVSESCDNEIYATQFNDCLVFWTE